MSKKHHYNNDDTLYRLKMYLSWPICSALIFLPPSNTNSSCCLNQEKSSLLKIQEEEKNNKNIYDTPNAPKPQRQDLFLKKLPTLRESRSFKCETTKSFVTNNNNNNKKRRTWRRKKHALRPAL